MMEKGQGQTGPDREAQAQVDRLGYHKNERRGSAGSGGAAADQDGKNGLDENFQIELQGPVINIMKVELHPLFEVVDLVPAVDLPKTGQSWFFCLLVVLFLF